MDCTNTQLDAPIRAADEQQEWVTVTDPCHPLFGRRFVLVPEVGATNERAYVRVHYCGDVRLKILAASTSRYASTPRPPPSKLSFDGIRTLLQRSNMALHARHDRPDARQDDESEVGQLGFSGSLRGEP